MLNISISADKIGLSERDARDPAPFPRTPAKTGVQITNAEVLDWSPRANCRTATSIWTPAFARVHG